MTLQSVQGQTRATEMKASAAPQKVDMSFPPGRPTSDTIEALCRNQKRRPLYKTNCPMGARHEHLARQAKTINRIETGFKHCCKRKQAALDCADQKVRENLQTYAFNPIKSFMWLFPCLSFCVSVARGARQVLCGQGRWTCGFSLLFERRVR